MIVFMSLLTLVVVWAITAAVVTAARDGYRAVPARHTQRPLRS